MGADQKVRDAPRLQEVRQADRREHKELGDGYQNLEDGVASGHSGRRTEAAPAGALRAGSRARAPEGVHYDNVMQVPALHKVVINIGMGEAIQNAKAMDNAVRDLTDDHRPAARA